MLAGGLKLATNKRVFTLRLHDEVFEKIELIARSQHRSMTNYIEYILLKHLSEYEKQHGPVKVDSSAPRS
jgi:hypothetical protein